MSTKTIFAVLVLVALATVPAVAQTDAPQTAQATAAEPAAAPVDGNAVEARNQSEVGAASSGVWTFITRENCYDLFLRSCTSTFPSPQCPPNAAGKPCSPINSSCWDTVSSSVVDYYRCR